MAKKRITSRPGLFGMTYHYDENGKCIGKSRPGLLNGTKVYFDEKGQKVGTGRPDFPAKEVHHDKKSKRYISSYPDLTGSFHRSNGCTVGKTRMGFLGRSYTTVEIEDEEYFDDGEYFAEEDPFDE